MKKIVNIVFMKYGAEGTLAVGNPPDGNYTHVVFESDEMTIFGKHGCEEEIAGAKRYAENGWWKDPISH